MILVYLGTLLLVWGGAWFVAGNWANGELDLHLAAVKEALSGDTPDPGTLLALIGICAAAAGTVLAVIGVVLYMTRKKEAGEDVKAKRRTDLVKLSVCALLVAMSFALSFWSPFRFWPQGGSVTFAAMVPVIFAGLLFGKKWGVATAFVNAVMQLLMSVPKLGTYGLSGPLAMIGCILLDYLVAYTVLSAAAFFRGSDTFRAGVGSLTACVLRYISHVLSGWLLFGQWAEEGYTPLTWSLFYNMSYMLPETVITVAVCVGLSRLLPTLRRQL